MYILYIIAGKEISTSILPSSVQVYCPFHDTNKPLFHLVQHTWGFGPMS